MKTKQSVTVERDKHGTAVALKKGAEAYSIAEKKVRARYLTEF